VNQFERKPTKSKG